MSCSIVHRLVVSCVLLFLLEVVWEEVDVGGGEKKVVIWNFYRLFNSFSSSSTAQVLFRT